MSTVRRRAAMSILAGAVVCSAATSITVPGAASATTASTPGAPVPNGQVALTWTPTYMSNNHAYTRAEAETVARKFDLVAAIPIEFKDHIGAMRAVNPDLTMLSYANATLATPGQASSLPEAAYAHTQSGSRITAPGFGTYLMESSNTTWRQAANKQCDDRVVLLKADGCLVDMLTLGIYSKGYVTGIPVKPGTGSPYTQAEYRSQMQSMAQVYRNNSPELVHIGNTIENEYRYWQSPVSSRPVALSQPGVQMEDFLRGAGTAVGDYPSATEWRRNVDIIRDLESNGVTGLFTTKVWVGASAGEAAAWNKYAMASFLMGANGHSYFAFTKSRDKAGASGANLPYEMPKEIGLPTGAMQQTASGAYVRWFGRGATVVNPGDSWTTVSLGGTYQTLDGDVVSSLTLAPHSGNVLTKVAVRGSSAPTASHDWQSPGAGWLTLGGAASDDGSVARAYVAVRNESTLRWLRPDGTWGAYTLLPATLGSPGATRTTWRASKALPAGRYGVSVIVEDGAGNRNAAPRPWVVVGVPSS